MAQPAFAVEAPRPPIVMTVQSVSENVCTETITPYSSGTIPTNQYEFYNDPKINSWLDFLAKCESGGNSQAIGDLNLKEPAYGMYQFQVGTFLTFGKQYGILPDYVNRTNFKDYIYDPITQRKIAYKMAQDGLQDHWKNCLIKYGK